MTGEPEIVYTTEHTDLWCEHHGHLASERACDYTDHPITCATNRQPTRVHVTITATIPTPNYTDIT